MSNLLEWKKSGRSVCGKYQATAHGAYLMLGRGESQMLDAGDCAATNRAICQRHAWKIAAQQAINEVCSKIGGAELSHALKVDSSQVSRWNLGRALVPARHCERIAEISGVDVYKLRPDVEFTKAYPFMTWNKRSAVAGGAE
jgi:DNA-binding transcriptional regulator YdaS (Cro superfamily)